MSLERRVVLLSNVVATTTSAKGRKNNDSAEKKFVVVVVKSTSREIADLKTGIYTISMLFKRKAILWYWVTYFHLRFTIITVITHLHRKNWLFYKSIFSDIPLPKFQYAMYACIIFKLAASTYLCFTIKLKMKCIAVDLG